MSFKDKLKELRRNQNLTQEQLAELLSVSPQAVSRWETGTAMPDISLLIPMANLFDTTIDDMLGRETEKSAEIQAYKERSRVMSNEGRVEDRVILWREAVKKYPGNFDCLKGLAFSLHDTLFIDNDSEIIESNAKEEIEICERILQECKNTEIRNAALQLLILVYSANVSCPTIANEEKALEYVSLASSIWESKEILLEHVYFTEESKDKKLNVKHKNILNLLDHVCMNIYYQQYDDPKDRIHACETALKLWETVVTDGNYLFFHCRIEVIYELMARNYAELGDAEKTISALKNAIYHAEKFDNLPRGELAYTSPLINYATEDTRLNTKNYTLTDKELIRRLMERGKMFDFIRDNPEFIELMN